jgi:hypothetical protein
MEFGFATIASLLRAVLPSTVTWGIPLVVIDAPERVIDGPRPESSEERFKGVNPFSADGDSSAAV